MSGSRERDRFSNHNMSKNRCEKCGASTIGTPYTLCGKCLDREMAETVCVELLAMESEAGSAEGGSTMSDDLDNCQYPDCGCDGARLCNARNGPNERALSFNVEGMHLRSGAHAARVRRIAHDDIVRNDANP